MRLLLSCISTNYSTLKKHWSETSQATQCPLTVLGSFEKPREDAGGLLCFLEDFGCTRKTVDLKMVAGMVPSEKGVFITSLDHPHAVRIVDKTSFTVADTVGGRALLVRLGEGEVRGRVEQEIDASTNWLQDCRYDEEHNCWILIDGKHSRLLLRRGRSGGKVIAQLDLDPEWRLYEAHVL